MALTISFVTFLLNDDRVNPTHHRSYALRYASENGHFDIVKLLIKDGRSELHKVRNYSIRSAYNNKHKEVVDILWQEEIIKNTLKDDDADLYNILIQEDIKNKVRAF